MDKIKILEASEETQAESLGGGRYRIRIIQPGPGSSGLYLAENLAASVDKFVAGTQMYIDHPTLSEDYERPERSVRDLAAKFVTDAEVGEDGSLYTEIYVYPSFDQIVREKWEDIGVSINAWSYGIMGPNGEVPPFDGVTSVDFVTKAGAGGAILELLESARTHENERYEHKENELNEEKFNEFAEATTKALAALTESVAALATPAKEEKQEVVEAAKLSDFMDVATKISEADLPAEATARVVAAIEAGADADEAIDAERAYVIKITESVKITPDKDEIVAKEAAPVAAFARTRKDK